jgi:epoxide hydrolase
MNAAPRHLSAEISELRAELPELAWRRLRLSLRRARANGEAWDASIRYGAPLPALERLLDYWCDEFDYRALEARLNALPLFERRTGGEALAFIHARSRHDAALPLLWLHGASSSFAEALGVLAGLTTAEERCAFHVVCPALPARTPAGHRLDNALASAAEHCADLMAALGYDRYVAHGSGSGARVASELARHDAAHVIALHVTALGALPSAEDLPDLSAQEKSRLLSVHALDALAQEPGLRTPVEHLALAVCQLADDDGEASLLQLAPELLWGLSYELLRSEPQFRRQLAQQEGAPLATRSEVPTCVCSFPLGRATLRRFAERAQRLVTWSEQDYGGELAALQQPQVLVSSLRSFCSAWR